MTNEKATNHTNFYTKAKKMYEPAVQRGVPIRSIFVGSMNIRAYSSNGNKELRLVLNLPQEEEAVLHFIRGIIMNIMIKQGYIVNLERNGRS